MSAGGSGVFSAKGNFGELTHVDILTWRKRRLFSADSNHVATIQVEKSGMPDARATLQKKDGKWQFPEKASDKSFRFDAERASEWAQRVTNLTASGFVEDDAAKKAAQLQLQKPLCQLRITNENGDKSEVIVAENTEKAKGLAQVVGSDTIYELNQFDLKDLVSPPDAFRDMSLLGVDDSQVHKLSIHTPKGDAALEKKGEKWVIVTPAKLPEGFVFDESLVSTELRRLKGLRAQELGKDKQGLGNAKSALWVELTDQAGKKERVTFSAPDGDKTFVKGAIDDHIYVAPAYERRRLEVGIELFQKHAGSQFGGSQNMNSLPPALRKQIEEAIRKQRAGG